jgi:hypothetical protein
MTFVVNANDNPRSGQRPAVMVEHGFVIVKPDGRGWDKYLYRRKETAEQVARLGGTELRVFPARKVFSLRKASTTTARPCIETIIDRNEAH